MFLVAVTKDGIAQNFSSGKIDECSVHSLKVTVVTDRFLSDFFSESSGFSVIESPLISTDSFRDVLFSKVSFESARDTLFVFKSTISGRPIYYHMNSQGEFFCSTHISLLRRAGVVIEENRDVLSEFFVFRFVMPPNTMYKNICKILSGGQLQIKLFHDRCEIQSIGHYTLPKENKQIKTITESSIKLYDYLSDCNKKLNICKNETVVLLSGGIDSSILSAICKDNSITKTSYSTGYPFEDSKFDFEKQYAITAAQALEMNHFYYEPTNQEYLTGFLEAISIAEEPLHHLQSVLFHLLFKNGMPSEKKIIIHGQGAGTTFGSNHYLYNHNKTSYKLLSKIPIIQLLKAFSKISRRMDKILEYLNKPLSKNTLSDPKNLIWSWMDHGKKTWTCNQFNTTEEKIISERYTFLKKYQSLSINDIWALYSFFGDEQVTLSIWTKIGEGNKKILYLPFYDQTVLDYVFSIPWKLRLHKPENYLRKELARQAHIPEFIINRQKRSFGIVSERWGEKDGIFEQVVPIALKYFNENQIRIMQSSEKKNAMIYWNILNYSIWKRLCVDNEPLDILLEELQKQNVIL